MDYKEQNTDIYKDNFSDHEDFSIDNVQKQGKVSLQAKIEALLVVHNKPLSIRHLASMLSVSEDDVRLAIDNIIERFNTPDSGVSLMLHDNKVQLVTASSCAEFVKDFVEEDHSGPLTRAQLETLSIIAYRGPVSRAEIEQIRGVNCSIILRNMLIRGFVTEKNEESSPVSTYEITADFLQHLGFISKNQLPDYDKLSADDLLTTLIKKANETAEDDDAGQEGDLVLSGTEDVNIDDITKTEETVLEQENKGNFISENKND